MYFNFIFESQGAFVIAMRMDSWQSKRIINVGKSHTVTERTKKRMLGGFHVTEEI
jgi:hypothetical protein